MKQQHRNLRRAFTLIEMLLVVVIIGVLAGAVTIGLRGRSQQARVARANADMQSTLALAIDMFEQDAGRYPTTDEGLAILTTNTSSVTGWSGPYVKGGLSNDPWGNAYTYTLNSTDNTYTLTSNGPDATAGTADDITVTR